MLVLWNEFKSESLVSRRGRINNERAQKMSNDNHAAAQEQSVRSLSRKRTYRESILNAQQLDIHKSRNRVWYASHSGWSI